MTDATERLRDSETDRQVHTHRACTWNSALLICQLCDDPSVTDMTDRLRDRETDRQVHTHRACTWNSPLLMRQLCDDPSVTDMTDRLRDTKRLTDRYILTGRARGTHHC